MKLLDKPMHVKNGRYVTWACVVPTYPRPRGQGMDNAIGHGLSEQGPFLPSIPRVTRESLRFKDVPESLVELGAGEKTVRFLTGMHDSLDMATIHRDINNGTNTR